MAHPVNDEIHVVSDDVTCDARRIQFAMQNDEFGF